MSPAVINVYNLMKKENKDITSGAGFRGNVEENKHMYIKTAYIIKSA
eukprot:CAMPEP_0174911714 /NCGR_PEP_ID=MMETSP0167-20121228/77899_1 /TAXON_ID=38298 /ORGANISM="Rhodella maculata, Strain CCMP736" /LENGTH=46 /DNA_ID= /DNA_START= /DNA_END= /DNA_ORIENTATION=